MDLVLLEAPLDALAFRLHFLPAAAASLWTWIAVLAVTLGLWGIRALGLKPDSSPATTSSSSPTPPAPIERSDESELPAHGVGAGGRPEIRYVEETCSPGDRFTAYYYCCCAPPSQSFRVEEENDPVDDDDDDDDDDGVEELEDGGARKADGEVTKAAAALWNGERGRWSRDDAMALKKQADLGWYRYQDLAALNGSVVRLWDGGRHRRFTETAAGFRWRGIN